MGPSIGPPLCQETYSVVYLQLNMIWKQNSISLYKTIIFYDEIGVNLPY